MSTTTTATATVAECIHGLDDPMWCSLCRKAAGWRSGVDRQENDCTIVAVTHLTGATYAEAHDLMTAAGRAAGRGATADASLAAIRAAGWTVAPSSLDLVDAILSGRSFFVSARKGRQGHAIAITGGTAHNAKGWLAGIRYRIWEVS